uniref:Uncharacterized protein n=1 Tax=Pararge aegeria TaxID=116150 RepID=S4PD85_9NEOP
MYYGSIGCKFLVRFECEACHRVTYIVFFCIINIIIHISTPLLGKALSWGEDLREQTLHAIPRLVGVLRCYGVQ